MHSFRHLLPVLLLWAAFGPAPAQTAPPAEADYYALISVPIPKHVELEAGGLAVLPDGSVAVATRFGEVWRIANAYVDAAGTPAYTRFAGGLHEVLGLAYRDGSLYCVQRGELTRLTDTNGDGRADRYERVAHWPLSGNYHEYSYGPKFLPDGDMVVTLNLAWVGHGASLAPWRGWMMRIRPDGTMTPWATGLRSPAGIGIRQATGDLFYAENQGDWVGSGRITHLAKGDFAGNPAGLRWTADPASPLKTRPADIPDTGEPMHQVAARTPGLKPPAVWFPQGIMGISTSDILEIPDGRFGPYAGQFLVGDQGHSKVMRMSLETVEGVYQGACFPFREGFSSGVLRLEWGADRSLLVGMTSRGWAATGKAEFGLQRVVWNGRLPFEIQDVRAMPDGFELLFTQPVDKAAAANPAAYQVAGFTYKYHHHYGSPVVGQAACRVRGAVPSADGTRVRLVLDGLRQGYIHEVKAEGLRSATGLPLLHTAAYYTLNRIPGGQPVPARLLAAAPAPHAGHAPPHAKATAARKPAPTAKRTTRMPAAWTAGPDHTLAIGTRSGLKYDRDEWRVKAGGRVQLVFNNTDDMQHNVVLAAPGAAEEVGRAALRLGLRGMELNYVPDMPKVLHHTGLLPPGASETIYFTAPAKPGRYTLVCTYPGHYASMQAVLLVTP